MEENKIPHELARKYAEATYTIDFNLTSYNKTYRPKCYYNTSQEES